MRRRGAGRRTRSGPVTRWRAPDASPAWVPAAPGSRAIAHAARSSAPEPEGRAAVERPMRAVAGQERAPVQPQAATGPEGRERRLAEDRVVVARRPAVDSPAADRLVARRPAADSR